ncbi:hypothetical protein P692DRAFT_201929613 [Suillus brevipes Sb2]|nr:hypothetical protein P692DRAFT_201929613 [Suillus brevipes Sb2]
MLCLWDLKTGRIRKGIVISDGEIRRISHTSQHIPFPLVPLAGFRWNSAVTPAANATASDPKTKTWQLEGIEDQAQSPRCPMQIASGIEDFGLDSIMQCLRPSNQHQYNTNIPYFPFLNLTRNVVPQFYLASAKLSLRLVTIPPLPLSRQLSLPRQPDLLPQPNGSTGVLL